MRVLVAGAVAVVCAVLIAAGVAARGPERSACGAVGDRERVVSPDGVRAAFVRCTSAGSAWLYVAEDGSERQVGPATYGCCYRPSARVRFQAPAWSPDGRRLAVVIADVGGTDVWVVDERGRSARRVTSGPGVERSPRWSEDGRRVSFVTESGGRTAVRVAPR